jgi:hypothetical protein
MATQLYSNCNQTRPHHSTQNGNKVEAVSQHPSTPLSCNRRKTSVRTYVEKETKKWTTSHQEHRCHAGSFAAMPLQQNTPPDRVNNTESEPLADCHVVAITITQRVGASPLPPLDSTSHVCARGPRHTRHITLHPESVSEVAIGVVSKDAPLPRVSIKQPSHRRSFDFASLLYPRI